MVVTISDIISRFNKKKMRKKKSELGMVKINIENYSYLTSTI